MARKMKDSGIEWIGEIPEGWEIAKAKYFIDISHGSDPKTQGFIPVYGSGSESFKTCGEYKEGPAVLIGRKGATLHIPHYIEGKYWNVDTAFDVKSKSHCILKFYYYLAACFDYKYYISQTTLPGMTQSNYYNMFLPVPSLSKQFQIATYLDAHGAAFDFLISKVCSSIEEYKKLKQAVITQAVTEGTPAMFSSPHSVKLKYLISIVSGEAIRNEQLSDFGEYPVYGGGEIIGFCSQYNTSEGSLIIGRVGARCGCVTHTTCKSWATDNALIVLPTCNAKYMYYVIGHCQLNNLNTSNAQPLITSTKIKNVVVPYFSDAMQQQEIADYLDAKCAEIDGLIAKKEQLVKELESYKKSLIYEVVTGKREV